MTPKLEQALYIQDLVIEKNNIKLALHADNFENIWIDSAFNLPVFFHSDMEPNYMEILMGLSGLSCEEDAPEEELNIIRDYINKKVDVKAQDNILFLQHRLKSVKDNIKYLKEKFKKEWGIPYKEALQEEVTENRPTQQKSLDVDDILDKINQKGINSLTEEERKFLKLKGDKGKDKDTDK